MTTSVNHTHSSQTDNPQVIPQPDLLFQFIGYFSDVDPTTGEITFRIRDLPPPQAERFVRFVERHVAAQTQILVLTYDLNDFTEYHAQIVPQLKAQQQRDEADTAPQPDSPRNGGVE